MPLAVDVARVGLEAVRGADVVVVEGACIDHSLGNLECIDTCSTTAWDSGRKTPSKELRLIGPVVLAKRAN